MLEFKTVCHSYKKLRKQEFLLHYIRHNNAIKLTIVIRNATCDLTSSFLSSSLASLFSNEISITSINCNFFFSTPLSAYRGEECPSMHPHWTNYWPRLQLCLCWSPSWVVPMTMNTKNGVLKQSAARDTTTLWWHQFLVEGTVFIAVSQCIEAPTATRVANQYIVWWIVFKISLKGGVKGGPRDVNVTTVECFCVWRQKTEWKNISLFQQSALLIRYA